MTIEINGELENRIHQLAADKGISVEALITALIQNDSETTQSSNDSRLQGILNSQIDLVCRYLPDTTLTYMNDAYCLYFGKPHDELIGSKFIRFAPEEARPTIFGRIEELRKNPMPDVRVIRSVSEEGEESWIQWVDFAILDKQGNISEIQAVGRDITALKTAESDLQEQKELLQIIIDHIPVMIVLFDDTGQFKIVNQEWLKLLGWTLSDIEKQNDIMADFYPDPQYRQEAIEYMLSGKIGWRNFDTVAKDGSIVQAAWANIRLPDGSSMGIGQENSAQRELEEQRLYAYQLEVELEKEREIIDLKERFISTVSHEFRTPLSVIKVSNDIMRRYAEKLSPEKLIAYMDKIESQVDSMVNLLDDVLSLSRNTAGKTAFTPSKFDIADFCQQLLEDMRLLDNNKHQLELRLEGSGMLEADIHLLEHVFLNLLSNALKYSPTNTSIIWTVRAEKTHWHFILQDEGIGIPAEDLQHLFEPFHRARNAMNIKGTGLGLVIVKQYIEMHAGSISVESVADKGTTFHVRLPC